MAAGDTQITIAGNLVDDPELRFTPAGQPVARFRVASTPRFRDNSTGEWKDGDSLFLTCNVWRQAAENVAESLTRGTRVIVSGRLRQRSYETKEGEKRTVYEIEVDDVGPSLRNASAKVNRVARNGSGGGPAGPAAGRRSGRFRRPVTRRPGPRGRRGAPTRGRPTVPAATPTSLRSDPDLYRCGSSARHRRAGCAGGWPAGSPMRSASGKDAAVRCHWSQAAGERRAPGVRRAPAAFLDPGRYRLRVGAGLRGTAARRTWRAARPALLLRCPRRSRPPRPASQSGRPRARGARRARRLPPLRRAGATSRDAVPPR